MKGILASIALLLNLSAFAQETDTTFKHQKYLPDITVVGRGSTSDYQQLPEIVGTSIYAGKKNALIVLDNVKGNVTTNVMRQVLAKVPGIHIWESDPSGIQIGIAARGLSPNRSWEFNIRQNGFDIAADPFGYPEAYYNPQLQAVQRIEVVRGQGALQYGPQFGGMVNYIMRNGSDIKKKAEFETIQTIGSYGLFNSFNAIGGKNKKSHYYAFFDHRNGDGFRENSRYYSNVGFVTYSYLINDKVTLNAEITASHIRSQQPGGLTDAQAAENPRQSLRSRNWFDVKWTLPTITLDYKINEHTRWNTKLAAIVGDRNSVGFLQAITVKDSINKTTGEFNPRTVNLDKYRNYSLESRFITDYKIGKTNNTLSAGIKLYTGTTSRLTNGVGTKGSDYDVSVTSFGTDITFASQNAAVFVENIFRVGNKILLIPGVRYEYLSGQANGRNGVNSAGNPIVLQDITRARGFLLAGFGAEYHVLKSIEAYANISQAYRPIQFANLQAPPTTNVIDQDLKDATGYNVDLGFRGTVRNFLRFDVSAFYMQYNNRIGTINVAAVGTTPSYNLTTNVGASQSKGIEAFAEISLIKAFLQNKPIDVTMFGSYAYTNATYANDFNAIGVAGKRLENAPQNIFRSGLTAAYKNASLTTQLSYVGDAFSDASNTEIPSANGNAGKIPAYTIVDITATYKIDKYNIKLGVNNALNALYFTRRAGGYPGPGAMPADGRTLFLSVGIKL